MIHDDLRTRSNIFSHPNNPGYLNEKVWDLHERVWISTPPEEGAGPLPNLTRGADDNPWCEMSVLIGSSM